MERSYWSYLIFDADTGMQSIGMQALGDIDNDGIEEIITGGYCGLFWYKYPSTKKHFIDRRFFGVGVACYDVDGDGFLDLVTGVDEPYGIVWYENPRRQDDEWKCHTIDTNLVGYVHNLLFADINGDGRDELVTNHVPLSQDFEGKPMEGLGLYSYILPKEPKIDSWTKHDLYSGVFSEGLMVADVNGDGRLDLLAGPDWYEPPKDFELERRWKRHVIAEGFRGRCSMSVGDVDRDGELDVLIAECEYVDGRWALFKNMGGGKAWKKIIFEDNLPYFTHTTVLKDYDGDGDLDILIAEMGQGGWGVPRNIKARVLIYENLDGAGGRWRRHVVNEGVGVHDAKMFDIDGDGDLEIVGKTWRDPSIVQIWDRKAYPKPFQMTHEFIDVNKKSVAIDILAVDVDGDGREDILCGSSWYHNPDWEKHNLPIIGQSIAAYDINFDGRTEVIGVKGEDFPFSSELYWLESSEKDSDKWKVHYIGNGDGDWPNGSVVGPVLEDGGIALIVGYHSAEHKGDCPQYFELPSELGEPWKKRNLANIRYGEEFALADLDCDGRLEVVAGPWWLKNIGDKWRVHEFVDHKNYDNVARVKVADINRNGRIDVVLSEERVNWETKTVGLGRVAWFEAPKKPASEPWVEHVVSVVRCPHSLDVVDLDHDGRVEILVGEHDPFAAYNADTFCKLAVYKSVDSKGMFWEENVIDSRFEHHGGARVIRLNEKSKYGIISHGWVVSKYLHLWK